MKTCPVCGCHHTGDTCPECGTTVQTVQTANLSSYNGGPTTDKLKEITTKELLNNHVITSIHGDGNDIFKYPFEPIDNRKTCKMIISDILLGIVFISVILVIIIWLLWY